MKVLCWAKGHKFLASVAVLFLLGLLLSWYGVLDPVNSGRILGYYVYVGGIVWLAGDLPPNSVPLKMLELVLQSVGNGDGNPWGRFQY